MVVDGQIVIRPIMVVALTYDHRLLDGREAVTFLGACLLTVSRRGARIRHGERTSLRTRRYPIPRPKRHTQLLYSFLTRTDKQISLAVYHRAAWPGKHVQLCYSEPFTIDDLLNMPGADSRDTRAYFDVARCSS